VKIDTNRIPSEGLSLEEEIAPSALDLETAVIKFCGTIRARAEVSKITNAVNVDLSLSGSMSALCSRCLNEFEIPLKKKLRLNYQADRDHPTIDLDPEIREEIIVGYPLKPLCREDCQGLCPKCGKNLNEGGCSCARS